MEQTDFNIDLEEDMIDELHQLKLDKYCGPGLVAMSKQLQFKRDNPAKLMSAVHPFGKSDDLQVDCLPTNCCCQTQ